MSELEDIKRWAAERRESAYKTRNRQLPNDDGLRSGQRDAEANLDRAIAIAENEVGVNILLHQANERLVKERNEARADVLKLRNEILWWIDNHGCCDGHQKDVFALTEHYEEHQ